LNRINFKLLALWISGIVFGAFAVVGDEIQPLEWNAYYNFPLIGLLPKFGGTGRLGAWDLVFVIMIVAATCGMILYGDLSSQKV